MFIILDSCILFSDFHLRGAEIESLCKSIGQISGKIYIPEVVIREVINQYREKINAYRDEIGTALKGFARLTTHPILNNPITEENVKQEAECFAALFRQRIQKLNIEVLPIPSISHEEMIARDLARKKPFTPAGKGYRDSLIWESILELCGHTKDRLQKSSIIFVTKNHKDFCADKESSLHPDLKSDLITKGFKEDCVRIAPDISLIMDELLKPKLKVLQNVIDQFNHCKIYNKIDLNNEVEKRITLFLQDRSFTPEDTPLRWEFEDPSVTDVELIEYEVTDARVLPEESVQVNLSIKCQCCFDFFIHKADFITLGDEAPMIINSDWNKHYMAANEIENLSLSMLLIIDKEFTKILSESISIDESINKWL